MKTRIPLSAPGAKLRRPFARVSPRVKLLSVFGLAVVIAALTINHHARAAGTLFVNPDGVCGGNAPCFTTIQAAINAASPGDTINVAAATYAEQIDINKALTLLGPNANISPNTGARVAEAIIVPTSSDPVNPSFAGPIVVTFDANGITFKGFTVDGNNPSLTSGVVYNGVDVDAEFGIYGTETANPDAVIQNNIVKSIGEIAVWINSNGQGGAKDANSRITDNKVDNDLGVFGQGIRISDDAWVDVINNVVTRVRNGIVIENYSGNTTTHPASVIADNNVTSFRIGIRHNLHYVYSAPGFTIRHNTVQPYVQSPLPPQVGASPTSYQGIRVESIQQTVFVTVVDNTLNGNRSAMQSGGYTRDEGLMLTNASNTSPNILFRYNDTQNFIRGAFNETPAVPDFECNNFANNTTGVYLSTDATNGLIIHNSNIAGNGFGMQNDGPATVNAQGNWWGASNGPGPVGPGSGDRVSTRVDFSNFLTATANCPSVCPTNVALSSFGATATASSTVNANFPASAAINGEHNGVGWGSGSGGWNDGTRGVYPDSITVNLNVTQTIDEIDVYTLQDQFSSPGPAGDFTTFSLYGITNYQVQFFNGSTFVDVPGGVVTGNNRVKRHFIFSTPITTNQIRVVINDSADHLYSRVVEIEAYSCNPVAVPTPTPTPTPSPTPCGTNIAPASNGSTAVASSQYNANYPASGVIDGEHNGNNWGSGGGWNDQTRGVFPDNVQVNFNVSQTINAIDVYTLKNDFNSGSTVNATTSASSYGIRDFNVQYWNGSAFVDVPGGAVTGNTLAMRRFVFAPITTDKIRVVVNDSNDHLFSRVVEIEAFSCNPAAIRCVNNGGTNGCFSTIQAAVNASNPGDIINVAAGTYPELVNVNKRLTLRGAQAGVDARTPRGPTNITTNSTGKFGALGGGAKASALRSSPVTQSPPTESVVTGNNGTTSFNLTASDVTIDGFTVQGATNQNQFGAGIVLGGGTAGAHILNNIIQNNIVGLFLANNSATDQAVIQRNLFLNNNQAGPAQGTGIYTDQFSSGGNLTNVLIDKNKFAGNNDAGIDFSSTNANSQSNVTISNNEFDTNFRAMLMFNLTSSEITGNNIHNSNGASSADIRIFEGNSGLDISCNTITNGAGRGMRVSNIGTGSGNSTNITANFNNISGNAVAGLAVDSGSYTGVFNAEHNWWGSATGPTIASNPGGTGDMIIDPDGVVDYTPFATSPTSCPTTTVSPGNQNGWAFFDDNPPAGGGSGGFENGPATPQLGVGSAFLQVNSTAREAVGTTAYAGTRLDSIGKLRYVSYQNNNGNTVFAASLQFDVDYDITDASNAYEGRLVFEPYLTPATIQQNAWQSWNALAGKWYGTRTTVTVGNAATPNPCQQNTPCTWQQVLATFPNAGMRNPGALLFKAGGPWAPGFRGNVDAFKISTGSSLTIYDFEPVP